MGQSGERVWRLESERERELLVEGEAWLRDCFSDCPERLTGADVVDGLERLYPGGAAGFRADGCVTP